MSVDESLRCATDITHHTSTSAVEETRRLLGCASPDPNNVAIEEGSVIARLAAEHDCLKATAALVKHRQANFQRRDADRN